MEIENFNFAGGPMPLRCVLKIVHSHTLYFAFVRDSPVPITRFVGHVFQALNHLLHSLNEVRMASTEKTVALQDTMSVEGTALNNRRRTHQFRALSRRTATSHKRNWKLDLCCLGLCPAYYPLIKVTLMKCVHDHCWCSWRCRTEL